jgi:hypothetical protein
MVPASDSAPPARRSPAGGRLRSLFDEAWQRARRRRLRILATGFLIIVLTAVHGVRHDSGDRAPANPPASSHLALTLRMTPSPIGRHQRVVVNITALHATGVFGKVRRSYLVASRADHLRIACVNNRDGFFPAGAVGNRIRAVLDPAQGDGGAQGWCPGTYTGTITYERVFACPSVGRCVVPSGFAERTVVVRRFAYRVS